MKVASKCRLDANVSNNKLIDKGIKDLFGIIVMVNVSVINHVILEIFRL